MEGVPSMWRVELVHPLVVHFPIALLLVGTALRLLGMAFQPRRLSFLVPAGRVLLALGTGAAWTAVYTGTLADAEVARTLCDPTVAETHENVAYVVAGLFTAAVVIDGGLWYVGTAGLMRRVLAVGLAGCVLAGSAGVAYVGHLGARLVYQQAAAVHVPADDCAAFE